MIEAKEKLEQAVMELSNKMAVHEKRERDLTEFIHSLHRVVEVMGMGLLEHEIAVETISPLFEHC